MMDRQLARSAAALALVVGSAAAQTPAPQSDTGSVAGTVRDDMSRPVEGARLRDGLTGRIALSDASGRFLLPGLPAGARPFEVAAVGFVAARGTVDVFPGRRAELAVTLVRFTALDSVRVTAEVPNEEPWEFNRRKNDGLAARVFTADEIARRRPLYVPELLTLVPGVRVLGFGPTATVLPGRGNRGACARMYIDGYPARPEEFNVVPPTSLAGIEFYYALQAPPQYARGSPCAVVLAWTKQRKPPPSLGPTRSFTAPAGDGAFACARRAVAARGFALTAGDTISGPATYDRRVQPGAGRRVAALLPGVGRGPAAESITLAAGEGVLRVEVVGYDEQGEAVEAGGEATAHAKQVIAGCVGG